MAGGALAGVASPGGGETGANTGSNCPTSNAPNTLALVAGTPQTATLGSAFSTNLQAELANSDGCVLTGGAAGVPVTFTAPASGASGVFSASATNTVTVGADSSGGVQAPPFTANGIAGSYDVVASSQYGSVTFSLTNTGAGTPARLVAISPPRQSATVAGRYRRALAVRVLDGDGNPAAGVSVSFTVTASTATGGCGTSTSSTGGAGSGAGATFAGGSTEASATSSAAGIAIAPALTADDATGTFSASAALSGSSSSEPHGSTASSGGGDVTPLLFTLTNRAGAPAKLSPGVGETQSTRVHTRFPIALAVTVTDARGNRVPDALVSFAAPAAGPSGLFADPVSSPGRSAGSPGRGGRRGRGGAPQASARRAGAREARTRQVRVARVRTNACGVALAPALTADAQPGGYVVRASAGHARAAFALVNEAR
ncbi:MAG TPA: hypothetical protein VMU32_12895 [Solirubrobacteraceae bacterium]|nr:hypothetical protein [Solirubrobacteraceae bacterium]